jgi:hypothetical protein
MFALLALAISPTARAYDSAINAGLGHYSFDYRDQARSVTGERAGWRLGYVGRFNDYIGFDARMGGTGETSAAGLRITPGFFLSPLFRPSFPVNEKVKLYGLIGFTVLAIGRTPAGSSEEIIARAGGSIGVGTDLYFDGHMAAGIELISYQHNVDYGPKSDYDNWTGVTQARVSLSSITASFKYQF